MAASTAAWSIANSSRTHSVALVQLRVAASGSQPPVESQNAAASPSGSTAGSARYANTVPDVPRLTATYRDDVAADRRAHVVAAARADLNARVEPERLGGLATQRSDNADRW